MSDKCLKKIIKILLMEKNHDKIFKNNCFSFSAIMDIDSISNLTDHFPDEDDTTDSGNFKSAIYIIAGVFVLLVLVTNAFIIFVLAKRKTLRENAYTVLVLTLGVADITVSFGGMTFILSQLFPSLGLCIAMIYLFSLGRFMSVYFTFNISLYRFISAISTVWQDKLYAGWRKYAMLFIPTTLVGIAHLAFTITEERLSTCSADAMLGSHLTVFSIYIFSINSIALFSAVFFYIFAIFAIRKRFRQVLPQLAPASSNITPTSCFPSTIARKKREIAALKTCGVIITVITIGTAPFLVTFLMMAMQVKVHQAVRYPLAVCFLVNSAANPAIYAWRLPEARKEILKLLCQCFSIAQ